MSRDFANSVTVAVKMNVAGSLASHAHTPGFLGGRPTRGFLGWSVLNV